MKSSNYAAWDIKSESFPRNSSIEDQISFLIGYGILAPSTHNTQPWLFEIDQNQLIITSNPDLALPQADPTGRNLQISLGCFVTNVKTAAEYFGLAVSSAWSPKSIKLTFHPGTSGSNPSPLKAITARYSDKLPYQPVPLKKVHKNKLTNFSPEKSCQLSLITDKNTINQIAGIQQVATLAYSPNRQFFEELSHWLKPSKTNSQDGMPGFVVGLSNPQSKVLKKVIRKFKPAVKLLAKKDLAAIQSSSAVGFITTTADDPESWFKAGLYYEELALEATANGLVMAPMTSIIEHQASKAKAKQLLKLKHHPQLFFRLGYSSHKPYHTPRRQLNKSSMETQQKLASIIKTSLEHKQIKIDSYIINYVVAGSGQPLLLLHGANIGWAQWYQNIAELAKHYKVYALDLPGAGNSTKVNFHKTDLEKDFLRIVDKFVAAQKFDKIDIIGSSFGGWIALKLAIEHRPYVNRIVLTNPLGFTSYMPPQFKAVSLRPLALVLSKTVLKPKRSNKKLEKFMRDVFYNKQQPLANEFVDYFYELSETSHNILFINRLAHISGMRKELFLKNDLPKINRPVLVIWGLKDPLMPFRTVKEQIELIPNVKLEKLEDVGHMPPVEAATKFNRLAISFLKAK